MLTHMWDISRVIIALHKRMFREAHPDLFKSAVFTAVKSRIRRVCHTCGDDEEFWSVVCVQRHDSTNSSARMREPRHTQNTHCALTLWRRKILRIIMFIITNFWVFKKTRLLSGYELYVFKQNSILVLSFSQRTLILKIKTQHWRDLVLKSKTI